MSGVVVLHFWSPTCGPCKVIKPALDDLKDEFESQIQWVSINTHQDTKGIAQQLRVTVVPTIVVLKNDVEIGRHSGTQVAIFYSLIRKALSA
jgi:thioredoxin-like negative regulator of GroEL